MLFVYGHVIPKIVKAHFIIRAVCNIAGICCTAFFRRLVMNNQSYGNAHEPIDLSHPFRVTLGQIIVDCDDVHSFFRQSIQVGRKNSHQRFSFAGLHFGNSSLMQHNAADDLNTERLHAENAPAGLPGSGERFRQNVIQSLAFCQAFFKLRGLGFQRIIRQFGILIVQCFHLIGDGI